MCVEPTSPMHLLSKSCAGKKSTKKWPITWQVTEACSELQLLNGSNITDNCSMFMNISSFVGVKLEGPTKKEEP